MVLRHSLLIVVTGLAAMGTMLGPTAPSQPLRLEPRRSSGYPAARVLYTFDIAAYLEREPVHGPRRMYYLVPTDTSAPMTAILLSHDQLLDHYRVRSEQLNGVPTRLPSRLFSKHEPAAGEAPAAGNQLTSTG